MVAIRLMFMGDGWFGVCSEWGMISTLLGLRPAAEATPLGRDDRKVSAKFSRTT